MQQERLSPCQDWPLLPQKQVSECIARRSEKARDEGTGAPDLESGGGCRRVSGQGVASVKDEGEGKKGDAKEREDRWRGGGPDGGWAWVVLLGSFVVMTLVSTVGPCFSLVFSSFLLKLGSSSTAVAWIFNTFSLVWNLEGPLVGPLTAEFGHRPVALVGSLLTVIAVIASAFATSAWNLFLCFSLLGGVGAGLVVTSSVLIVPLYFTRRLGRANGLLMAGTSVGQFVAPHLITHLQEEYAFRGATLVLGAVLLNACAAASTFHPVEWHAPRPGSPAGGGGGAALPEALDRPGSRQEEEESAPGRGPGGRAFGLPIRVLRSAGRDLRILGSRRALVVGASSALVVNGYLNFVMMAPFAVRAKGHSPRASAWCVSAAGVCSLLARLLASGLADFPGFDVHGCFVAGIFAIAASSLAFPFLTRLSWLMVAMGVWGCGVGAYMGLYNLVMIRQVGVQNLPSMFGAASLLNGLGFVSLGPFLGLVSDLSGSHSVSIWLVSGTEFLCVVLWLFMPRAIAREDKERGKRLRGGRAVQPTDGMSGSE